MAATDIIAAIATPLATGGIGVIRISGGDLRAQAAALQSGDLPPPRRATRMAFIDAQGRVLDDGLALYFPAPLSFTGESVLELHAHGGVFVLRELLSRCLQLGARQAEPGEFTLRACLNNKLDLTQAEGLADLINAGGAAAARAAAQSLRGAFSAAIAAFGARLRAIRADLESGLDFGDDDALAPEPEETVAAIAELCGEMDDLLRQTRQGAALTRGATVVIAGAPNVGKSSLMNQLANDDVAIVTPSAGTTRDVIERQIVVNGFAMSISDTAGLRATTDEAERQGVSRARQKLATADIIVIVGVGAATDIDGGKGGGASIRVVNKIDLSGEASGERDGVVYLSAKTGAGMDDLRAALTRAIGHGGADIATAPFSARQRHVAALERASDLLRTAKDNAAMPEVAAAWLRDAQAALAALVGGVDEEALLGEIFSRFCVGK